jgi:class 3 adenylate cyclase
MDVRNVLPSIHVPTLILHRSGDRMVYPQGGRFMAARISGAKYVELPGGDHIAWAGDREAIVGEVEEFLTGMRHESETDRVLTTVLFSDIVNSTDRAAALGDKSWKGLLTLHDSTVRRQFERFRGRVVKSTGDGFLGTFDGPARAVRCAAAIIHEVNRPGLSVRAGIHTGEIKLIGDDIAGIAVHIASRVSSLAASDEVLVSSTVRDLTAGSGILFEDRGSHSLKGIQEPWRVFAVTQA